MEDKDIIGKEFTCFEFPNGKVTFDDHYKTMMGLSAKVLNLHNVYPEWANSEITMNDGSIEDWHYPTAMIKQQIEANVPEEEIDINALFEQINNNFK